MEAAPALAPPTTTCLGFPPNLENLLALSCCCQCLRSNLVYMFLNQLQDFDLVFQAVVHTSILLNLFHPHLPPRGIRTGQHDN